MNSSTTEPSKDEGSVVPTDADDPQLVAAAREGNRQAFQALYRRYERRCYAVAYGFLRNQEDALDVVQEAFIKVHRHLGKFEGQSSFYTWLYRITANLCIDHMRRNKRLRDLEYDDGMQHGDQGDPGGGDLSSLPAMADPAQAVRNKEILRAVQESLEHLSEKHRAVIVMRELRHMSYADMAEAMNCSKGTIMSRLFHARRNLQRLLEQRLADTPGESVSPDDSIEDSSRPSREAVVP